MTDWTTPWEPSSWKRATWPGAYRKQIADSATQAEMSQHRAMIEKLIAEQLEPKPLKQLMDIVTSHECGYGMESRLRYFIQVHEYCKDHFRVTSPE